MFELPPAENVSLLVRLFGPPRMALREAWGATNAGGSFSHARFDALLARHVCARGLVDYAGLREALGELDGYLAELAVVDLHGLSRDHRLALFINAYNACTLRMVLAQPHLPASIRDIPTERRWKAARWTVAGHALSLEGIEQDWLRARFREPRIHLAINCASMGCPPLWQRAYTGESIADELEAQAQRIYARDDFARVRHGKRGPVVELSPIHLWYRDDFAQVYGSVPGFVARYHAPLRELLGREPRPRLRWMRYDWRLNRGARRDFVTA